MTTPRRILVAVAWPYANGLQHLGHFAGAYLPPDIYARFHRISGNDVLMVSGADGHGTPITVMADAQGIPPSQIVDEIHPRMLEQWERLGIDFDLFTTTTTDNHREVTWEIFRGLHQAGLITAQASEQYFDPQVQRFLPDRYVEGTCPNCGYGDARGDQCDNCGRTLDPTDLVDPRSTLSDAAPQLRTTQHWFFDLPQVGEELAAWLDDREGWRNHVINWARGFVGGLHARAITRDLDWGVPVPPEFDTLGDGKRIYVWFDAVIGYLSASIEWAAGTDDPDAWRQWWNGEAETVYFIGKDNIPFHAVFWVAQLMGYNRTDREYGQLNLPTDIPANQYVTFKGEKASKSRGIGTPILDYLDTFSADQLRFAVARHLPEFNDADIAFDDLVAVANQELANDWGNLVNRVMTMTTKNFDGAVPEPGPLDEVDDQLLAAVDAALAATADAIERVELRAALQEAMEVARATNAYLNARAPWKTAKVDTERTATTLWVALQAIGTGTVAFAPFTPFSSQRIRDWIGLGPLAGAGWTRPVVAAGTPLGDAEVLFPRIEVPPTQS